MGFQELPGLSHREQMRPAVVAVVEGVLTHGVEGCDGHAQQHRISNAPTWTRLGSSASGHLTTTWGLACSFHAAERGKLRRGHRGWSRRPSHACRPVDRCAEHDQPDRSGRATLGAMLARTHGRPRVANHHPFSEAQFKTLTYRPEFPDPFGGTEDARAFCRRFFHLVQHRASSRAPRTAESAVVAR
jgi:hypothetical protein